MHKPKIFLVDKGEEDLITLEETSYVTESVLQELLVNYPDLLPGDQINPEDPRRWLLVAREMGIPGDVDESGRWSLDHLFIDQDGIPTFVECKRAEDTRIRREVVAQMLDYAANGTEYWTMDRLRQAAAETCQNRGNSLDEEIANLVGADDDEADIEAFWEQVETNLRNHRVRLVFVADRTPKELRRLIEFLNDEMGNVQLLAVEVKQFQRSDGIEQKALVPRVIGLTEAARSAKGTSGSPRRKWTEKEFFAALSEQVDRSVYDIVENLYEWSGRTADRVRFGSGVVQGSITFHYVRDERTVSVFSIYTSGNITINFHMLSSAVDSEIVKGFHEKIVAIPSLSQIPDLTRYPSYMAWMWSLTSPSNTIMSRP
ncbi:unnamed protein product [marine sediment metagenome]|uniref:Uncharacterized protein n=1 Tax=marine sediment metagenome TaxID=412755 RepID=X1B0H1_9ZZZZ